MSSTVEHTSSVLVSSGDWSERSGCRVCWISPDGSSHILHIRDSIDQRVFRIWWVLADGLVVATLSKITNSERTVRWVPNLVRRLGRERTISSVGFPEVIESTVLEDGSGVWLRLVEDQSSSSLVV